MSQICFRTLLFVAAFFTAFQSAAAQDADKLFSEWRHTRDPRDRVRLNEAVVRAAISAERPDIVEEVAAGGQLARKELSLPRRARRVSLRELRTFDGIETALAREDGYLSSDGTTLQGWLVRRITRDAWEVWTPTHGWLFDGSGRLLNEARPARGDGTGREWFGAFLPDGRWVTTDLEDTDCTLTFFSRDGQRTRQMTSGELVPSDPRRAILGWGRSDKEGAAWIVNVGSEEGYATVRVGPEGPARVLSGIERWQLCYPRALGPRGGYISLDVPDDAGRVVLDRRTAAHGLYVGFPDYSLGKAEAFSLWDIPVNKAEEGSDEGGIVDHVTLPDGNEIFGFWPGGRDVFIGTEAIGKDTSRKRAVYPEEGWVADRTWFFNRRWRLQGWTRARRLADAADGRSLLLRTDDDGRIVTLRPDLRAAAVRRFVWPDGGTAAAVTLYDDLRLGLFVRGGRLVLARW